ncbi:MAG: hypothetical protein HYY14_05195 [Candidatus Omnitrophica bacterium]|nr:hypothetical protein [Candidatus Omnitrophota bacterium]
MTALFVTGTCLTIVSGALAQADLLSMSGEIVAIDIASKTLSLKGESFNQEEFVFEDNVKVLQGGDSAALEELAQGDQVTVWYREETDGQKVSEAIEIQAAEGASPEGGNY